MIKKLFRLCLFLPVSAVTLFFLSCIPEKRSDTENAIGSRVDMVDMFMGNLGGSYCVIGPQLPHGSVNPSPQTPNGEHDGYNPSEPIRGFGQLHVSGTGWGRYGQIFISPQTGFEPSEEGHDSPKSDEKATPYYYSVDLTRYGIKAEVTPTHNCAAYRFTFPNDTGNANILLDIAHSIPQHITPVIKGKFYGGAIHYDHESNSLNGWGEYSGGFGSGKPYKVYFAANLDVPPREVNITDNGDKALFAQIALPEGEVTVHMNFGISFKSVQNAKKFLSTEIGSNSFDQIRDKAKQQWEETLSLVDVKGGTEEEQRLFYTALYHSFVMPHERTGDNPHWESEAPHIDDHYCIWDTWRTKYPLMMLLNESFVTRTVNSFIDRFAHNGTCQPTFISSVDGENKQGGDNVDNVIADAFVKNIQGFDREKAYEIIKFHAFNERSPDYLRLGWQPETGNPMSCTYNLEFAYNDYCASLVAEIMGDTTTARLLKERSSSWKKHFNPNLQSHGFKGFIGPRQENGEWVPIDPEQHFGSWVEYFYESNSWVYSLFVPHQFERLIELCGGKEEMVRRLSYGFDNGLIHTGNEPGFLSPFLFSHCGRSDLAARYISAIRKDKFSLTKGYPDNEDGGALGSWYVFTSIGIFPNAGQDLYYLLPPAFSHVVVKMENGNTIEIEAKGADKGYEYIQSVTLNGKKIDRPWIRHSEIAGGAVIRYELTDRPTSWGSDGFVN